MSRSRKEYGSSAAIPNVMVQRYQRSAENATIGIRMDSLELIENTETEWKGSGNSLPNVAILNSGTDA
jgi:hypothetical protein